MTKTDPRAPILVTAFEPFGAHPINPTAEALRALRAGGALAGRAHFLLLPVTYRGAPEVLLARARRDGARGCLMFGLAGASSTPRVERAAYNWMEAPIADNAGALHAGRALRDGGVERAQSRGPVGALHDALRAAGAPVTYSEDPGRFVCNATYYRALTAPDAFGPVSVFVHVPPTSALGGSLAPATLEHWVLAAAEAYEAALSR